MREEREKKESTAPGPQRASERSAAKTQRRVVPSFHGSQAAAWEQLRAQYNHGHPGGLSDSEILDRILARTADPFEQAMARYDDARAALYHVVPESVYELVTTVQAYTRQVHAGTLDPRKLLDVVKRAVNPLIVAAEESTAEPLVSQRKVKP